MKRIISAVLSAIMFFTLSISASAFNGDIAGSIYSTDIKACINGVWVDSYNIGGKTVVIVEDITNQYLYSDELRTLIINDFAPEYLVNGQNLHKENSGAPIGNIYETDIKTFFRGKELTSYSLNGKMAIVMEELGDDGAFSDIGGKYIWNPVDRTITLESIHRYPYSMRNMLEDSNYNIILTLQDGILTAQPVAAPLTGGQILCEKEIPDSSMIPINYNGETIGYKCRFPETRIEKDENGAYSIKEIQTPVEYFYVDKVEKMISEAGAVALTAEDWLNYLESSALMTVKDSLETEDYIFLYAFFAHSHGGTDGLIKLSKADGTRVDYDKSFESVSLYGQRDFENVVIDKENEKVYLHYDVDYVIDLKTDAIEPTEPKADLLLISRSPAE